MSEETRIAEAGEAFTRDTAAHEITILEDDGLYRHVRFQGRYPDDYKVPEFRGKKHIFYYFDLVTWPGSLVIRGDMESYLFTRLDDMFEFFRDHKPNPGYWAEKLPAAMREDTKRYSEDLLAQLVAGHVTDAEEERWPGLRAAAAEQVTGDRDIYNASDALRVLSEFEFGATVTGRCSCGAVREGLPEADERNWESSHRAMAPVGSGSHLITREPVSGFQFCDAWDWDLRDWTHQFLWCCHAIPWGIAQYDQARAAKAVTAA